MSNLSDLMAANKKRTLSMLLMDQLAGGNGGEAAYPQGFQTGLLGYGQDMSDQGIQQPPIDQTAGSNDYGPNRAWLADLQAQGQYMPPDQGNQAWLAALQSDGQYIPPETGSQSQVREVDNATPTGQGWQPGLMTTGVPHQSGL